MAIIYVPKLIESFMVISTEQFKQFIVYESDRCHDFLLWEKSIHAQTPPEASVPALKVERN